MSILLPLLYIFDLAILKRLLQKKKVHPFPSQWVEVLCHTIYIISGLLTQRQWQTSVPNKTNEGGGGRGGKEQ